MDRRFSVYVERKAFHLFDHKTGESTQGTLQQIEDFLDHYENQERLKKKRCCLIKH